MKSFTKAELEKLQKKIARKGRRDYNNKRVFYDGEWYHSIGERDGYISRQLQEKAGEIFNLERQIKYRFEINGVLIATYKCDYRFYDKNAVLHVQDFKPKPKTKAQEKHFKGTASWTRYRFNCKLMKAIYGIDVETVYT